MECATNRCGTDLILGHEQTKIKELDNKFLPGFDNTEILRLDVKMDDVMGVYEIQCPENLDQRIDNFSLRWQNSMV